MRRLDKTTANKLNKILSKRLGRDLTQDELENAYDKLMTYAFELINLETKVYN